MQNNLISSGGSSKKLIYDCPVTIVRFFTQANRAGDGGAPQGDEPIADVVEMNRDVYFSPGQPAQSLQRKGSYLVDSP